MLTLMPGPAPAVTGVRGRCRPVRVAGGLAV